MVETKKYAPAIPVALLLCCMMGASALLGQNISFEQRSTDDGLSHQTVLSLTQDHRGFLWVGTVNGLNRYDGYRFRQFKNSQGNPGSLSSNQINALLVDRKGVLWAGTNSGLNRLDAHTEVFTKFQRDPANANSLASNKVICLYEDAAGTIWVGTDAGLERFDAQTGQFAHYPLPTTEFSSNLIDYAVRCIAEYRGKLMIGTWGAGIWAFDPGSGALSRVLTADPDISPAQVWVEGFFIGASGRFWALQSGHATLFDEAQNVFKVVCRKEVGNQRSAAISILEMASGELLVGTSGDGLKILGSDLHLLSAHIPNPDQSVVSNNWVNSILQDHNGEIWLGMTGGGLFKFDPQRNPFESVERLTGGLPKDVHSLKERRNGELWLASRSEGCHVLPKGEGAKFANLRTRRGFPEVMKQINLRRVFEDSRGYIWMGFWGGGLMVFDEKTGQFRRFPNPLPIEKPGNPYYVNSIWESPDGRIWAGIVDGLMQLSPTVAGSIDFQMQFFENFGLPMRSPTSFASDRSGKIWIGTDGLVCFDPQSNSFQTFQHDPDDPQTLGSQRVTAIFEDRKNRLWVGTNGGGLNLLDQTASGARFIKYREKDGLANDVVVGIVEDGHGLLWLTTERGLSRFDPERGTFANFFRSDGLPCERFSMSALGISPGSGRIFAGGLDGFVLFHPDSIRSSGFVPPVVISNLKKYVRQGEQFLAVEVPGITDLERIELPFSENTLTFEFAALNFRQSFKNQYAYKLEGMGQEWIPLGARREVTFSNLQPGRYVLHVKASNNDGLWNEAGTKLEIRILPPWWMTWWAYTLYALTVAGVLFAFFQLQIRRREDRAEVLRQKLLNEAKSQFLSTVSHELRTPLTSILGFSKIIKKRLEERVFPNTNLSDSKTERAANQVMDNLNIVVSESERLTTLINEVLDLAKIESGKLVWHEEKIDVRELIERASAATKTLFEQKKLWLRQEIAPELPTTLGDADRLLQVLVNLLSNAVKFTERGGVTVSAKPTEDRKIVVGVADTGIGIPKAFQEMVFEKFGQVTSDTLTDKPQGTGLGLPICKEIVEHHGGQIWVESAEGEGSVFWFTLPLR